MTGAEILLERFDALLDTPESVERLRSFLLRLCVTGRLTRSINDFWPSVTLGEVVEVTGGGTPSKRNPAFWDEGTIPWVSPKDMKVWEIEDSQDHVTEAAIEGSAAKWIEPGAVLVVVRGMILAHTFPAGLLRVRATINQDMKALRPAPEVEPDFLLRLLWGLNSDVLDRVETSSHGTKRLPTDALLGLSFRLPPRPEQRRIVARVDELMALCDRLADGLARRDGLRRRWAASTVRHVAEDRPIGTTPPWAFAEAHLDTLVAEPEAVPLVRRLVLDLAVRGRLTAPEPGDEPADALLRRVAEARAGRVAAGEIRKPKTLPPVEEDERPFEVRAGWAWARVGGVGRVQLGRQRSPKNHQGPHMRPYLRVANVYEARIDTTDVKEMNFSPAEFEQFKLYVGDVLLNEGQSAELVGRPAIYGGEVPGACFQNTLVRVQPYASLESDYFLVVFRAYLHNGMFTAASKQTTNIAHLGAGRLAKLPFPVPPPDEQRRIATRVNDLMAFCDRLEAGLERGRGGAGRLLDTLLHAAVESILPP